MSIEEFLLNEDAMAEFSEDQLRKLLADMAERILMLENRLEQAETSWARSRSSRPKPRVSLRHCAGR